MIAFIDTSLNTTQYTNQNRSKSTVKTNKIINGNKINGETFLNAYFKKNLNIKSIYKFLSKKKNTIKVNGYYIFRIVLQNPYKAFDFYISKTELGFCESSLKQTLKEPVRIYYVEEDYSKKF